LHIDDDEGITATQRQVAGSHLAIPQNMVENAGGLRLLSAKETVKSWKPITLLARIS
jgi:hypothetical protein